MPRVIQSPEARSDIKAIGRHIAYESRSANVARRFLNNLAVTCQRYASHPQLGEVCPHLGHELRRFSQGNYNIYFRAANDGIELVRVIHGNRDESAAWHLNPQNS